MNTEATQEKSNPNSTGARLRSAREQMGLSQQHIADRLCLKLSTVRDIEDDKTPTDLASTFLRGYIRSYARLVHVPEDELLPMMAKQVPLKTAKVAPMQNYALGKRRKKRDGWLSIVTWLIIFVVIGLTGAWWWQNHKAAQNDLVSLAEQNNAAGDDNSQSIQLDGMSDSSNQDSGTSIALTDDSADNSTAADNSDNAQTPAESASAAVATDSTTATTQDSASVDTNATVVAPSQAPVNTTTTTPATTAETATPASPEQPAEDAANSNALVMNFTQDCWLEVRDATGKKLFSGMQHSGGKLNLTGTAPYRLKIGAPAAVQIQYQGNPVDLSRFIRTNQVARLSVGTP